MAVPYYNVGTATLTAGSTAMVGQGTLWLGNVRSGDQVVSYAGETAIVDTVDSNTSITLVRAFQGASQAAAAYEIVYTPDDPFTQTLARQVLQAISGSALVGLSGLVPAARKLPYFDPTGAAALTDLSDTARTLLAGATGAAMYGVLGVAPDASMPDRFRQDGATIPSLDYNLALTNGFYRGTGSGGNNVPPGSAPFGPLLVFGLGGLRVQQIAAYGDQYYSRSTLDSGATWSTWDIFVPTETVTGSGTTTRFPGGVQVCASFVSMSSETGVAFGNIFLGTEFRWTFPTAFKTGTMPKISAHMGASGSRTWLTGGGQTAVNNTGAPIQPVSSTANMSSGYANLIAWGEY